MHIFHICLQNSELTIDNFHEHATPTTDPTLNATLALWRHKMCLWRQLFTQNASIHLHPCAEQVRQSFSDL